MLTIKQLSSIIQSFAVKIELKINKETYTRRGGKKQQGKKASSKDENTAAGGAALKTCGPQRTLDKLGPEKVAVPFEARRAHTVLLAEHEEEMGRQHLDLGDGGGHQFDELTPQRGALLGSDQHVPSGRQDLTEWGRWGIVVTSQRGRTSTSRLGGRI